MTTKTDRLPPKDFGRNIYNSKKYLVITEDSKGSMSLHFDKPESVSLIINFLASNDTLREQTVNILKKIEESKTEKEEGS